MVNKKIVLLSIAVWLLFMSIECVLDKKTYFSVFNPITQTALLTAIFGILYHNRWNDLKIIRYIGLNSLIIYLYHISIVQPIAKRLLDAWFVYLVKPIFCLFIMVVIMYVGTFILKKVPYGKKIMDYVGLREFRIG
jgi:peptidoglycan/LPS O-acetylase OafA/YrhL